MYRSFLVPLDGSASGEAALPLALAFAMAAAHTAEGKPMLRLAHVHIPAIAMHVGAIQVVDEIADTQRKADEQAYLETMAQRMRTDTGLAIACELLDGPIVETLAEFVGRNDTDLVVLTTHGRGPLERLWLGSVTDGLIRRSTVPLLVVRPPSTPPVHGVPPALRHMLIPLDGSPLAEHILEPALALGALTQATYTLVQVVEPAVLRGYAPLAHARRLDTVATEKVCATARSYLSHLAEWMRSQGFSVRTRVIVAEHTATALLDAARDLGVDLLAMATHGRGGLSRVLLGSVADKVVRGSDRPVLLYRPEAHMSPIERMERSR